MPRSSPVLVGAAVLLSCVSSASCAAQPPIRLLRRSSRAAKPARLALAQTENAPKSYAVSRLRTIPHLDAPWTQGLEFSDDGKLVETSGDYPFGTGSYVRIVDTETGVPTRKITDGLAQPVFIEGISELGGRWFASTYMDHVAIEYDRDFNFVKQHPYPWQGWGLARSPDSKSFLATNSSEWILSLDSDSFELLSKKPATCRGQRVPGLNELEMVDNFLGQGPALLGNVINTRLVLVLDPATAECTGAFHLNDLEPVRDDERLGNHVANGIAYDRSTGNLWVTGKNWESMYEISVSEDTLGPKQEALEMLDMHLSLLAEPQV